jgi:hypothetical protein
MATATDILRSLTCLQHNRFLHVHFSIPKRFSVLLVYLQRRCWTLVLAAGCLTASSSISHGWSPRTCRCACKSSRLMWCRLPSLHLQASVAWPIDRLSLRNHHIATRFTCNFQPPLLSNLAYLLLAKQCICVARDVGPSFASFFFFLFSMACCSLNFPMTLPFRPSRNYLPA